MKVYIGGGSDEREQVQSMMSALRARGIEITFDWTQSEGYSRDMVPAERREQARLDLEGVRSADIVWIMAPAQKSEGSAVEMGAALALRKRVIVSGPHARRTSRIFALLAEIHDTHVGAYEAIVGAYCPPRSPVMP